MKNRILIFSLLFLTAACKNNNEKNESASVEQKVSSSYTYSEAFSLSMQNVLGAYFNLKDAFVAGDNAQVNTAGTTLKTLLDSLTLDEVQQKDSLGFFSISGRPGDVVAEITGMLGETDLEKKRESFEMISNAMYDLLRVIKPAGTTVYYTFCPMAFDNKGAYWLSNTDSISNPYFGKKMLTCGEVKETLKY